MTYEVEDTGFYESEQGESFQLKLPGGLWLEMADTWSNRRGVMIFLRCLRRPDGRPLMTYEAIARELGYPDRRNVHNFWAAFAASGEDLACYLRRKKKVDEALVGLCEQIWKAHPLWSAVQVYEELVRCSPDQASHLCEENVRTAGHQIGFLGIQQVLKRQLTEGEMHVSEPILLEALFELADAGAVVQADLAGQVAPIREALEAIRPQGEEQTCEPPVQASTTEALKTSLLEGDASPRALKTLWGGVTGRGMLAFVLYFHGLSLEVIGSFFGVHKTTVMRWLEPLSALNWQDVVVKGQRFFSGILAVDEKWIKINGVWWYLFVAVDHVSGFPLHVALFPSNAEPYCRTFLLEVKALGYRPQTIITDGWDAYVKAIATVFPHAQHLLCRFHALQAAFRSLKESIKDWKLRTVWVKKLRA